MTEPQPLTEKEIEEEKISLIGFHHKTKALRFLATIDAIRENNWKELKRLAAEWDVERDALHKQVAELESERNEAISLAQWSGQSRKESEAEVAFLLEALEGILEALIEFRVFTGKRPNWNWIRKTETRIQDSLAAGEEKWNPDDYGANESLEQLTGIPKK